MPLSATSTLAEINAQYVASRFYALDGNLASARLFAEACSWLLTKPLESEDKDGRVRFDRGQIRAELSACDAWLSQFAPAAINAVARATRASFGDFRR